MNPTEAIREHVEQNAQLAEQDKTKAQSYIMSKERFKTETQARAWLDEHDVPAPKVDETETSFRFRQFDPSFCKVGTLRTIEITDGVSAVICRSDGEQESENQGRMGGPYAAGPDGNCICPECGKKMPHRTGIPCTENKCPSCGVKMVRTTELVKEAVISGGAMPFFPRSERWNANQARRQIRAWATTDGKVDATKYARAFLVVDGDAENLTSYKLPIAKPDADGRIRIVPRALNAVAALLGGARGGVELPEGDREKIKKAVDGHRARLERVEESWDACGLTEPTGIVQGRAARGLWLRLHGDDAPIKEGLRYVPAGQVDPVTGEKNEGSAAWNYNTKK